MPKSKKIRKEAKDTVRLSAIDEDVLTILGERELYGLELLNELNPGRPIPLQFSSLYPALNRLEQKGLVSWRWGDEQDESGGARRKYYTVTPLGADILRSVQEYRMALVLRAGSLGLPEEIVAELAVLQSRLQKQNLPSWRINLEFAIELVLLLWSVHIQIRFQNFHLNPGKKHNID
jgi:PadR family transcriptional regulator, regulatory protein PadR